MARCWPFFIRLVVEARARYIHERLAVTEEALKRLIIGVVATIGFGVLPLQAFDDVDVATTLETRSCFPGDGRTLDPCDLTGADFTDADLEGVYLTFADATGAVFVGANLANSYIRFGIMPDVDFTGANLAEVNFESADLSRANLTDAILTGAWMTNATLREATLAGADLSDANLNRANLRAATLTEANLSNANLTGATLSNADMTGANLAGALIDHAGVSDANLTDADLTGAEVVATDLTRAILCRTTMPDGTLEESGCPKAGRTSERLGGSWFVRRQSQLRGRQFLGGLLRLGGVCRAGCYAAAPTGFSATEDAERIDQSAAWASSLRTAGVVTGTKAPVNFLGLDARN